MSIRFVAFDVDDQGKIILNTNSYSKVYEMGAAYRINQPINSRAL